MPHLRQEVADMSHPTLSVVVPMFNEEEVILETHRRLVEVLSGFGASYEIVYVDDGSKDKTLEIVKPWALQDQRVRLVSFARNFGHQAAVTAGLEYAKGDAIVIIDADLQDPPLLIPDMVKLWQQGWDVVYGKRIQRKGETLFKKWTAAAFYRVLHYLTDGVVPKDTGDFRLIDKKVKDTLLKMPEHHKFLRGIVAWMGYKQTPIEYVREARFAGTTKYPLKKMLKLAMDGIFSFSAKPLAIAKSLSVLCLLGGVVWLVLSFIFALPANIHFLGSIIVIGFGLVFMCLGFMGEYIGRMMDETRCRPNYIVRLDPDEFASASHENRQIRTLE